MRSNNKGNAILKNQLERKNENEQLRSIDADSGDIESGYWGLKAFSLIDLSRKLKEKYACRFNIWVGWPMFSFLGAQMKQKVRGWEKKQGMKSCMHYRGGNIYHIIFYKGLKDSRGEKI